MKEQEVSELPVELIAADEDMVMGTHRLSGFKLCAACERMFILPEFAHCRNCSRMFAEYEDRFRRGKTPRIDLGVIPHHQPFVDYDPGTPGSRIAVGVVFFGALCSAMFVLTGMWYTGRALIGICLEHTTK